MLLNNQSINLFEFGTILISSHCFGLYTYLITQVCRNCLSILTFKSHASKFSIRLSLSRMTSFFCTFWYIFMHSSHLRGNVLFTHQSFVHNSVSSPFRTSYDKYSRCYLLINPPPSSSIFSHRFLAQLSFLFSTSRCLSW